MCLLILDKFPLPQKKSLDDMLALVTEENIHSEISTGYTGGKEAW